MKKIYKQPKVRITKLYDDVITESYDDVGNFNPDWLSGFSTTTDVTESMKV